MFETREACAGIVDRETHPVPAQLINRSLQWFVVLNRRMLGHLDDEALAVQPADQFAELVTQECLRGGIHGQEGFVRKLIRVRDGLTDRMNLELGRQPGFPGSVKPLLGRAS